VKNAAAKAASTVAETAEKSSSVLKSAENFTSKLNDVAKNAFADKGGAEEIPNTPQDAENAHIGEVSDTKLSEKSGLNTAAVHVIKAVSVIIPAAKGLLKFAEKTSKTLTLIKFFLIAILVLLALILVGVVVSIVV